MSSSRRRFLRQSAGAMLLGALNPLFGSRLSYAEAAECTGQSKFAIFINLDGGLDSLEAYPFFGEFASTMDMLRGEYYASMPAPISLRGNQGINSVFSPISSLIADGHLQVVNKVGYEAMSGSHETARQVFSFGARNFYSLQGRGWLARLIDSYQLASHSVFGLNATLQADFRAETTMPILTNKLSEYNWGQLHPVFGGETETRHVKDTLHALLENMESKPKTVTDERLLLTYKTAQETIPIVQRINDSFPEASTYPTSLIGGLLADTARIVRDSIVNPGQGSKIIYIRYGGFDTHANQREHLISGLLSPLALGLARLIDDLKSWGVWDRVVIYCFSEFARKNYINNTGTDHGGAGAQLLLGGALNGISNPTLGTLPSISEFQSTSGCLTSSVDFRGIIAEILSYLGFDPNRVFSESFDNQVHGQIFNCSVR